MPVQLPLERAVPFGEHVHLACDELVDFGTVEPSEVAIEDETAVSETEVAHERPVPLDGQGLGKPFRHVRPKLRVVSGQKLGGVPQGLSSRFGAFCSHASVRSSRS